MTNPKPIRHRGMVLRWDGSDDLRVGSYEMRGPITVELYDYGEDGWNAAVLRGEEEIGDSGLRRTVGAAIDAALREAERHVEKGLRSGLRLRNRLRKMRGAKR